MASESFMPLSYGGHVQTIDQAERIVKSGIEKISFNTALYEQPEMVRQFSNRYGKQSVVASIDIKKNLLRQLVVKTHGGTKSVGLDLSHLFNHIASLGVGEILLTSIDRDGMLTGFDYQLISFFREKLTIPIVACGGASNLEDFPKAIMAGASAVAVGALFYFKGSYQAVLINYPDQKILKERVYQYQ
jgi:cyclase